jgi:hypothetical protein
VTFGFVDRRPLHPIPVERATVARQSASYSGGFQRLQPVDQSEPDARSRKRGNRLFKANLALLAEGEGFEPSSDRSGPKRFSRPLRDLAALLAGPLTACGRLDLNIAATRATKGSEVPPHEQRPGRLWGSPADTPGAASRAKGVRVP